MPQITHWALVIGINHYPNPQEVLRGCVSDANAMKRYLEMSIGQSLDVVLLTAETPTISTATLSEDERSWPTFNNVKANLCRISDEANHGHRVFIYYAGHGTYIKQTPAIVLLDDNGNGKTYLRLNGLYNSIEKMSAKGVTVTLVLDCCFSGALVRGDNHDEIRIRCLNYDPTVAHDSGSEMSTSDSLLAIRDAAPEPDWPRYADTFVVLCACAPQERTYEELLDGRVQGLFTHHLLHALNMLVKDGIHLTHAAVHAQLSTGLHAHWTRQTPMRYGKVDDVLFGDSLLAPENGYFAVYRHKNDLRLRAGEAHGIAKGDEFYMSSVGTKTVARVANVRVTTASAVESDLEVLDKSLEVHTISGWKAKPLSSLSPRAISIGIPSEFVNTTRTTFSRKLRYLRLMDEQSASRSQSEESCTYKVITNGQDQYEIVDPVMERVFPIPTVQCSSDDATDTIMRILQHIADYKYFEGLENRVPCPTLRQSLQVLCSMSADCSNKINVTHGQKIKFSFTNTGDEPLYVSIFDLSPSWEVIAMAATGFKTIPSKSEGKDGTATITMKMEVPGYFKGITNQQCDDHIKFIISNTATHFHWALPSIFQTIRGTHGDYRGHEQNLQTALTDFFGSFRGDQENRWATRSFFIRTTPAIPSSNFE
jgi:hypothetical protein